MHKYTLDVHAIYTVHAGDVAMQNTYRHRQKRGTGGTRPSNISTVCSTHDEHRLSTVLAMLVL